nr:uncharacterized protein LOC128687512 [Cherax quadricarinatus]
MLGPLAEHVVALCQTRQDQLQWVEALNQQSRLVRTSNFTPHKSSLTSPPVPPAHVSVWPNNTGAIVPHSLSQPSVCMSCELPYYPTGECGASVKVSSFDGNGYCDLQRTSCHCTTPAVGCSLFSMSSHVFPTLPVLPSGSFYVSRPYAILTKYITNMYRRKIITKKLLRQLAGDREDENVLHAVQLRRHKTECTIRTGNESGNESDTESKNPKTKHLGCPEERCDRSSSSDDGGYWLEDPEDAVGALSPIPKKKQYPIISSTAYSNLHKWRCQPSIADKRFISSLSTSGESGVSTDGSNPYGYVRYYNPDNSSATSLKVESLPYEQSTKHFTYTKPCSVQQDDFINYNREVKSSGDEFYCCLLNKNLPALSPLPVNKGSNSQEVSSTQISEDSKNKVMDVTQGQTKQGSLIVTPTYKFFEVYPGRTDSDSDEAYDTPMKTIHSSTLNIPAAPIILPSYLPSESEYESTVSSPNICDRTIYEGSVSSDDVLGLDGVLAESRDQKNIFPFKTKPDVAYYVSSCSGDETGEDTIDYYESHRKQVPMTIPLSRSEPNLCRKMSSTKHHTGTPKFSSHYVQLVHSVENPAKVCNCESHSHRSSDSGLADVIHHLECCPLRSETPGLGRGSSISRCSHSSQFSTVKSSRSTSSCQGHPFASNCSADADSLLLTPTTTPHTSAPVSYTEDSLSSLIDSVTLHHSTSAHELSCTSCLEPPREESVFRSGLYAHWWMKASVCPKALVMDKSKKDYLRFRVDKKPEVPPKPKFLKPSYHIRRGGTKGAVTKPTARSTSTQTSFTQPYQPVKLQVIPHVSLSCLNNNSLSSNRSGQSHGDESVRPKLRKSPTHLSPQTSITMSRDRSFESQASQISQVTVIPRLSSARGETSTDSQPDHIALPVKTNISTLKIESKLSQESSGNSCTELSSLHSFSESCDRDGNPPHLRDSSEGLDVDFHRRASSHSLHVDVAPSDAFKSTLYCQLQPFPCISTQKSNSGFLKTCNASPALGVFVSAGDEGYDKPSLPPKPLHLQLWPIKRSRSLPKLPLSSITVHTQSKDFTS